ncbi:MAG: DUF4747 family protein [Algicola sp.]|nr:DUF4747 family protein [Algicola sp.]
MDTFYFGRLNFVSKRDLYKLLDSGYKYRPEVNINFGVFNLRKMEDRDFGVIITGELIKYKDYIENEVVKDNKPSTELVENAILGKCRFFLLEQDHLIAYNPYGKIIDDKAFCHSFSGVIIAADDTFDSDSLIYPINNEYEFLDFVKKMRSINKLTINLTPSNPNNRDLWKDVDDKLNEMNVKIYKETFTATKGKSLNLQDEEESKIHMAEDGYGKAFSEGVDQDGNEVSVSTDHKDSVMKKKISKTEDVAEQYMNLRGVFDNIRNRFSK